MIPKDRALRMAFLHPRTRQREIPRLLFPSEGKALVRRRTLRQKWADYAYYRDTRRMHFDDRHPGLRWLPWAIVLSFISVSAVALVFNFGNPLLGRSGSLLSLVIVDVGFAAVAVMAWLMGRKLWREDLDPRYLAAAIGFAGLPVWGVLETVCFSFVIPVLSLSEVCVVAPDLSWVAVLWLVVLPVGSIAVDFRAYLGGRLAPIEPPAA